MPVIAGLAIGVGVAVAVASVVVAGGFMSNKWGEVGIMFALLWPVVVLWWLGERLAVKAGWN